MGHAPRERVSWNLMFSSKQHVIPVTLHVSVWVEMTFLLLLLTFLRRHAPRERVSWNVLIRLKFAQRGVTLHVSVWVEMTNSNGKPFLFTGHAPRERVSWNNYCKIIVAVFCSSRSTWACELKSAILFITILVSNVTLHMSVWVEITFIFQMRVNLASRSTWACELKYLVSCLFFLSCRHAPRERVSWNNRNRIFRGGKSVTLHVSVWVEMQNGLQASRIKKSRSTWACELKFW